VREPPRVELIRGLAVLAEAPDARTDAVARALGLERAPTASEYADVFLFQLYPYASVYLSEEGMLGGEARDRIAGFLTTLGASPPAEPDHLSFLLAAHAELATPPDDAEGAKRQAARKAFLWEHLLSWLPAWLRAFRRLDAPDLYHRWADLVQEALRNGQQDTVEDTQEQTELSERDIEQMLRDVERLAEQGRTAEAQQMLEMLSQILANMDVRLSESTEGGEGEGDAGGWQPSASAIQLVDAVNGHGLCVETGAEKKRHLHDALVDQVDQSTH